MLQWTIAKKTSVMLPLHLNDNATVDVSVSTDSLWKIRYVHKCKLGTDFTTFLTLSAPTLQNGQTHSNNSSAVADELFECVWPFCEIGALRVNIPIINVCFL